MIRLQAARRTTRAPRPLPAPDSPRPTTGVHKLAVIQRQLRQFLRPWHSAVVVAVVVLGVLVGLVLLPADETPPGTSPPPARPPSAAPSSTAPDHSPCPAPTVEARTKDPRRAHATFCADRSEFLLFDDSPDGKSAVLVVRVNGKELPAWFNSSGHQTRSPDGSQVTTPPQTLHSLVRLQRHRRISRLPGRPQPRKNLPRGHMRFLDTNLATTLTPTWT
jgi:hypothetical protein